MQVVFSGGGGGGGGGSTSNYMLKINQLLLTREATAVPCTLHALLVD